MAAQQRICREWNKQACNLGSTVGMTTHNVRIFGTIVATIIMVNCFFPIVFVNTLAELCDAALKNNSRQIGIPTEIHIISEFSNSFD
mmetsp:Transcript_20733/g.20837  ORF Transcript_20733/g.20837 Transcript_20733/m.20837 type:complete len:87 (+) Transcript_20733:2094-2354(+)